MSDTADRVRTVIAECLGRPLSLVTPTATLEELGADSADALDIEMDLETEFDLKGIDMDFQTIKASTTVHACIEFVEAHQ